MDQFGPACRLAILVEDRFFLDLWLVHEANVADLSETVEVPKFDKDGNPALDKDGNAVIEEVQRPRLMSETTGGFAQHVAESASIDGHGRMVPKVYSNCGPMRNCALRGSMGNASRRRATKVRYWLGAGYHNACALQNDGLGAMVEREERRRMMGFAL